MSIKRTALSVDKNFTIVPNAWLRDGSLSLRARGLLAQLMSHSVGWEITVESLVRANPEGRDATRKAINELICAGYLTRGQERADGQKFGNMSYVITEPIPGPENPTTDSSTSGDAPTKNTIPLEDHLPVSSKPAGAKRAVQLPSNWEPTDEHKERAAKSNLSLWIEAEKFRLHAAENERKAKNWNAAFTRWLITAEGFAPKQPKNQYNPWEASTYVA